MGDGARDENYFELEGTGNQKEGVEGDFEGWLHVSFWVPVLINKNMVVRAGIEPTSPNGILVVLPLNYPTIEIFDKNNESTVCSS